jgi:hypothetical protein
VYGSSTLEIREDRGKSEGRMREERVGKARAEILSHSAFSLPFPLDSLYLPWSF